MSLVLSIRQRLKGSTVNLYAVKKSIPTTEKSRSVLVKVQGYLAWPPRSTSRTSLPYVLISFAVAEYRTLLSGVHDLSRLLAETIEMAEPVSIIKRILLL